jgi:hypothetical protein
MHLLRSAQQNTCVQLESSGSRHVVIVVVDLEDGPMPSRPKVSLLVCFKYLIGHVWNDTWHPTVLGRDFVKQNVRVIPGSRLQAQRHIGEVKQITANTYNFSFSLGRFRVANNFGNFKAEVKAIKAAADQLRMGKIISQKRLEFYNHFC